jgi:hypothetical protein
MGRKSSVNWRKAVADAYPSATAAAVESVLRAAGSAPTQGGGMG